MAELSARQKEAVSELAEWREDVAAGIGPRAVVLGVPAGWGRSIVLKAVAEEAWPAAEGDPVTFIVRIDGSLVVAAGAAGAQAAQVRDHLAQTAGDHQLARTLGLDRPQGLISQAVGAGSLAASGLGLLAGLLVLQEAVTTAGNLRDASRTGELARLGGAARAVAGLASRALVVVLVDDADQVNPGVVLVLAKNLLYRDDARLLLVAAAGPQSILARVLARGGEVWMTRRVAFADADPDMGLAARTGLAQELCPGLEDRLARRIGQRTATFAQVYQAATADRLADLGPGIDPAVAQAVTDTAIDAATRRPYPSPAAVTVHWAGGVLHARQLAAALAAAGDDPPGEDPDLFTASPALDYPVVRLADTSSPQLRHAAERLSPGERRAMAAAVLAEAAAITTEPGQSLVSQIVAARAAHRTRGNLTGPDLDPLPGMQRSLITALEAVGDLADAARTARQALDTCPPGPGHDQHRAWLTAAILRLSAATPPGQDDLAARLAQEALDGGAAIGTEARVWAAITLLATPGRTEDGGRLATQAAAELGARPALGQAATLWRLQLATQAGRARRPDLTQQILAPLLAGADDTTRDLALRILHAADDPRADIRLRITLLEAELAHAPGPDDQLRIHSALAHAHYTLGDYRQARDHSQHELNLRAIRQGPDHPDTLATRHELASYTGEAGDVAGARDQFAALLPVVERVLGAGHPGTLGTRHQLASYTGEAGDVAGARDQYAALLAVRERVLGPEHPDILGTRHQLAHYTGEAGDVAGARDQYAALLPVMERVLGAEHSETLSMRRGLEYWAKKAATAG